MSLPEVTFSRLCIKRAREKLTDFYRIYLQNGLLRNSLKRNGINLEKKEAQNKSLPFQDRPLFLLIKLSLFFRCDFPEFAVSFVCNNVE